MPTALLPAAGASRRMGRPKLLLPFAGTTVLGALVASLRAAGVERICVVAAPGDVPLHDWVRRTGCALAINPDPSRGMLSSILAGLAGLATIGGADALARGREPLLIAPADLPAVRPETIRAVLAALAEPGVALAWPTWQGSNGHPLALAPTAVAEIPRLDPAIGLVQIRERLAGQTATVAVDDPGAVRDVDTPDDLAALEGL